MTKDKPPDTIIVVDFGSQYSQLIVRRVREAKVYCHLVSWRSSPDAVEKWSPRGIILSGGPNSVYDPAAPTLSDFILNLGVPILGICYGMQLLVHHFGGNVARGMVREFGPAELSVDEPGEQLFAGWDDGDHSDDRSQSLSDSRRVWMSHGDLIEQLAPSFHALGHTENSPYAAIVCDDEPFYGLQFHPEVGHTRQGSLLIHNFVREICRCEPSWTPHNFVETKTHELKERIGNKKVLVALSGGIDSATTAALLHRAVGKQLLAIFVDHGLLRKGEVADVVQIFQKQLEIDLVVVQAADEFLRALKGIRDPESKRRIIGEKFVRIFEREARKTGEVTLLAQGTIYPDVIESASKDRPESETIKTHHNVGGLPSEMDFEIVEPLRFLFKDEVRAVAAELEFPESIIWRQPFPGPGLAIRCIGEVTRRRLAKLREADAIFRDELARVDMLRGETQQAFAILLPVQSVGVMGDGRTYQEVVALRAVQTDDFMTADWARLPSDLLSAVSRRIVNEVPGVNRVVYDITSKPPATIEWE